MLTATHVADIGHHYAFGSLASEEDANIVIVEENGLRRTGIRVVVMMPKPEPSEGVTIRPLTPLEVKCLPEELFIAAVAEYWTRATTSLDEVPGLRELKELSSKAVIVPTWLHAAAYEHCKGLDNKALLSIIRKVVR